MPSRRPDQVFRVWYVGGLIDDDDDLQAQKAVKGVSPCLPPLWAAVRCVSSSLPLSPAVFLTLVSVYIHLLFCIAMTASPLNSPCPFRRWLLCSDAQRQCLASPGIGYHFLLPFPALDCPCYTAAVPRLPPSVHRPAGRSLDIDAALQLRCVIASPPSWLPSTLAWPCPGQAAQLHPLALVLASRHREIVRATIEGQG